MALSPTVRGDILPPTSQGEGKSVATDNDVIEKTKREIRDRLDEIRPLIAEKDRLEGALAALEAGEGQKRGRGRGSGASETARRKQRTKRAGRGQRREQLLEVVRSEPGLRPSEAARRMEINPAQLHTLARKAEEDGLLERREGGLYAVSAPATS